MKPKNGLKVFYFILYATIHKASSLHNTSSDVFVLERPTNRNASSMQNSSHSKDFLSSSDGSHSNSSTAKLKPTSQPISSMNKITVMTSRLDVIYKLQNQQKLVAMRQPLMNASIDTSSTRTNISMQINDETTNNSEINSSNKSSHKVLFAQNTHSFNNESFSSLENVDEMKAIPKLFNNKTIDESIQSKLTNKTIINGNDAEEETEDHGIVRYVNKRRRKSHHHSGGTIAVVVVIGFLAVGNLMACFVFKRGVLNNLRWNQEYEQMANL